MTKDEAMKLALEALTNAIAVRNGEGGTRLVSPLEENAITAIEEALAQPEQEPVETYIHEYRSQPHPNDFGISKGHWWQAKQYADALYTTPPQRKPLSDDELSDIWFKQSTDWMEFARAIEAAHNIKENI